MRLRFRTRGGPVHGWGNIFRLASFADWCRKRGHRDCLFFVEGPPAVHAWLRERDFEVVELPEDTSVEHEEAVVVAHGRSDVVIMEMLEVTWDRQAMLRRHADRLVVFDDLCDRACCADLVVCGQALPSTANEILSAPHTRFLTGPDYFLSRPEFLAYADRPRALRQRVSHVLVSLGGGRYDVGYLKCALALRDPTLQATFILGYANHGRLAARIQQILPSARVLGGVGDMPERLWATDLAVVSAGYTKLEAALTSTPAVMMSVQWHQIPLASEFSRVSGMRDLGYMSYVHPREISAAVAALQPRSARAAATRAARAVVDGRGFERVYSAIFEGANLEGAIFAGEPSL